MTQSYGSGRSPAKLTPTEALELLKSDIAEGLANMKPLGKEDEKEGPTPMSEMEALKKEIQALGGPLAEEPKSFEEALNTWEQNLKEMELLDTPKAKKLLDRVEKELAKQHASIPKIDDEVGDALKKCGYRGDVIDVTADTRRRLTAILNAFEYCKQGIGDAFTAAVVKAMLAEPPKGTQASLKDVPESMRESLNIFKALTVDMMSKTRFMVALAYKVGVLDGCTNKEAE